MMYPTRSGERTQPPEERMSADATETPEQALPKRPAAGASPADWAAYRAAVTRDIVEAWRPLVKRSEAEIQADDHDSDP